MIANKSGLHVFDKLSFELLLPSKHAPIQNAQYCRLNTYLQGSFYLFSYPAIPRVFPANPPMIFDLYISFILICPDAPPLLKIACLTGFQPVVFLPVSPPEKRFVGNALLETPTLYGPLKYKNGYGGWGGYHGSLPLPVT